MSYYTLAISSSRHDSSICLLEDDRILAMWPCERISRNKHTQKITLNDIKIIKSYTSKIDNAVLVNVYDENVTPPEPDAKIDNLNSFPPPICTSVSQSITSIRQLFNVSNIQCKRITVDNGHHHLYHAAAGFYSSGLDDAVCIVMDGIGSTWMWKNAMLSETTSIFYANRTIQPIYKHFFYKPRNLVGWTIEYMLRVKGMFKYPVDISPHLDIGKMYGTTTRHIGLGSSMDAGKTMGLAAYGEPNNLPPMLIGDSIISDLNLFRNDSQINTFLYPDLIHMSEQDKRDLAYNVQKAAERVFVRRVEQALSIKQCNNLILGGGCALNILANSIVKQKFPHLNIYIEPIAADTSQSLGAALFHYKNSFPKTKFNKLNHLYLGPE